MSFHAYYPARGRKHKYVLRLTGASSRPFHAYYPARGRKLKLLFFHSFNLKIVLSRLLPRKGTETFHKACRIKRIFNLLSRLLPRKGTETRPIPRPTNKNATLSRLLPRKGTETG